MENASCLLICGNTALYLALISRLPYFNKALPAMLLVLGLGLVMLLAAARFRKIPAVRIGVAPLPLLSLLLLPPGPAWITFLPAPLVMALFAVLDRFDWDDWQTRRLMRPVMIVGAFLILRFAMRDPPPKEGILLCAIFFALVIIGLRMQRMDNSETGETLLNVGGVVLPVAIGAGAGGILGLALLDPGRFQELMYWIFYPVIWFFEKVFSKENEEDLQKLFQLLHVDTPTSTPAPTEEVPTEGSIVVPKLPEIDWPLLFSVLLAIAAIVFAVVLFKRLMNARSESGPEIAYVPEKKAQKRTKRRPRSTRAVNRVRDAYRTYLVMLRVRREIPLKKSDTSLQVQERAAELPGQEPAEELRQIYLEARYAEKATVKDARRAEAAVKKIKEQFLAEERKMSAASPLYEGGGSGGDPTEDAAGL